MAAESVGCGCACDDGDDGVDRAKAGSVGVTSAVAVAAGGVVILLVLGIQLTSVFAVGIMRRSFV